MKTLWLLLLAACADPVAPTPEPMPPIPSAPVLRFVASCGQPAIWWLRVDDLPLPPTGKWWLAGVDSLDFTPSPGVHRFEWTELNADGWPVQVGAAMTDSLGAVRVTATCQLVIP